MKLDFEGLPYDKAVTEQVPNMERKEIRDIVEKRKEKAVIIMKESPHKTVFDIVRQEFLPVRTVRELKQKVERGDL